MQSYLTVADHAKLVLAEWKDHQAQIVGQLAPYLLKPLLSDEELAEMAKVLAHAKKHLAVLELARKSVTSVLDKEKSKWMEWERENGKPLAEAEAQARALANKSASAIAAEKAKKERDAKIAIELERARIEQLQNRLAELQRQLAENCQSVGLDGIDKAQKTLAGYTIKPGYFGEFAPQAQEIVTQWAAYLVSRRAGLESGELQQAEAEAKRLQAEQAASANEAILMAQADAIASLPEPETKQKNVQKRIKGTATLQGYGNLAMWYVENFGQEKLEFMLTEAARQGARIPGVHYEEVVIFVAK
jgi:hypothetical protein